MLFQIDFTDTVPDHTTLEEFWTDRPEQSDVKEFANSLVKGTREHLETIDHMIETVAENWVVDRMAAVDRNILRFATYELLFRKDIPPAVTINEAIEIAKKYSSTESASFLNGILDRIAREAGKVA